MQSTGHFAAIYRFGELICGPKNRVFDIKSGHVFVGIEALSRLSIFRSMGSMIISKVPLQHCPLTLSGPGALFDGDLTENYFTYFSCN